MYTNESAREARREIVFHDHWALETSEIYTNIIKLYSFSQNMKLIPFNQKY